MNTTTNQSGVAPTRRSPRHLSERLDREWEQLCRRPVLVEHARSWQVTPTPFDSLPELLRLVGYKVPPSTAADEALRRLVAVGEDDTLAARMVLQRLLPGLLAIVRREQYRDRSVDAFDLVIAEAWLAIVTYRVDLRATQIAARLLNDARHRAFTSPRRKHACAAEEVVATATLDLPRMTQPRSSFEELITVLGDARRDGLADDDLVAVRDYLGGDSPRCVAQARKVTPRTLRNRRQRSLERIRRLAAA